LGSANLPGEAIYLADDRQPLDGANVHTSISIRTKYRRPMPSGRSPSMTLGLSGRKLDQPFRGFQLDALHVQPGRLVQSLFPERQPGRDKGGKLAASTEKGHTTLAMRLYAPKSDAPTDKWNRRR
jgi:hypothetical protein